MPLDAYEDFFFYYLFIYCILSPLQYKEGGAEGTEARILIFDNHIPRNSSDATIDAFTTFYTSRLRHLSDQVVSQLFYIFVSLILLTNCEYRDNSVSRNA